MNISKLNLKIDTTTIQYSSEVTVQIDSKSYALSLISLRYHKKMFTPGHIIAKIQMKESSTSATKTAPALDKVVDLFSKKVVTLSDDAATVAEGYYVHTVCPEYRRLSDGQYVYVTLHIYSPDHKLTQNKFCKTYVNQKLSSDILSVADNTIMAKAGFTANNTDFKNLRFLNYFYVDSSESDESKKVKPREFLQPYLVQYNESFYDLVARTANRCGEFFFYEGGKLNLGLAADSAPETKDVDIYLDNALSVNYENICSSVISDVETRFVNTMESSPTLYSSKNYVAYDEFPFEDYLGMDFEEDSFMTFAEAMFTDAWTEICKNLNAILSMSSVSSMISKFAVRWADAALSAPGKMLKANRKGNDSYVKSTDGSGANLHASEQYDSTKKTARLYGSMLTEEDQKKNPDFRQGLSHKFYQFVSKAIDNVSAKMVKVNVGSQQKSFSLGQYVVFESKATVAANEASESPKAYSKYIVVDVEEVLKSDCNEPIEQRLVLMPCYSATVKVNDSDTTLTVPCPPRIVPFSKTSGTQRAFVAVSGDPQGFGRVCIRYPWQMESDACSPWIRMAVPFAPNDSGDSKGGFYFQPNQGDEVLVDYENGNIEHPYVIGVLYTGRSSLSKPSRIIASQRGHSIQFNDDDSVTDFIGGIVPAVSQIEKYIKLTSFDFKDIGIPTGKDNVFAGGVTICDKWGLYKIDASATKRAVSIDSPFGKVDINAFTGITISAPNGDIKIAGKNITLEAGNEVKIVSGKNIDEKEHDGGTLGDLAKGVVDNLVSTELAPFTDMSLARSLFECFCKPVSGTMSLQSGRYMLLAAGGGKVAIPNRGYSANGLKKKDEDNVKKLKLSKSILKINDKVDEWYNSIATLYENCKQSLDPVKSHPNFNKLTKPDKTKLFEVLCNSTKNFELADVTFSENNTNENRTEIRDFLNAARPIAPFLLNKVKEWSEQEFPDDPNTYCEEMNQIRKSLTDNMFPEFVGKIKGKTEDFTSSLDAIGSAANKKELKRMMIEKLIGKLKVVAQCPEGTNLPETFSSKDDYGNDAKWEKYVKMLDDYDKSLSVAGKVSSAIGDKFKESMTKNLNPFVTYNENQVWDTCKQGEILFADKGKNETINIVNGVLNRTPNVDGYDKQLKDLLANI